MNKKMLHIKKFKEKVLYIVLTMSILNTICLGITTQSLAAENKQITIKYTIDTSRTATGLSGYYKYDGISIPTIENENTYTETIEQNKGTTIKNISEKYLTPYSTENTVTLDRTVLQFDGWRVNGTNTIIRPEEQLTWNQLSGYAQNGVINLTTKWKNTNNYQKVNFYINFKSKALDSQGNVSIQDSTKFTPSLWASYVGNANSNSPYIADTSVDNSYKANAQIRKLVNDKKDGSIYLYSFPSDDYIFQELKKYANNLSIDGGNIPIEELTSKYYEVRWYVFKLQNECWHIDGKLVKKQGKLKINKTFTGSKAAIQAITGYSFTTNKQSSSKYYIETKEGDATKKLYLTDAINIKNETESQNGVTTYKLEYTWIIDVKEGAQYNVTEKNYKLENYIVNVTNELNDPQETKYKKIFNPDGTYYYEKDSKGNFITTYQNQTKPSANTDTVQVIGIKNYAEDNKENINEANFININYTNTYAPTTAIKVIKTWLDTTQNDIKPVTIELYINNKPLSNYNFDYDINGDGKIDDKDKVKSQIVLNKENNWQYEWPNMPIYIDGQKAIYSIKEIKIGEESAQNKGEYDEKTGIWKSKDAYARYKAETTKQEEILDSNGEILALKINISNKTRRVDLPETGGTGTFSYYYLGILLTGFSSYNIILRKRRETKV